MILIEIKTVIRLSFSYSFILSHIRKLTIKIIPEIISHSISVLLSSSRPQIVGFPPRQSASNTFNDMRL